MKWPNFAGEFEQALNKAGYITNKGEPMKEDGPLDPDKMTNCALEFSLDLAKLILSKDRSREMQAGIVSALADVLVLMTCKMVGMKTAYEDIVPMAIAHGFAMAKNNAKIAEIEE